MDILPTLYESYSRGVHNLKFKLLKCVF